MQKPKMILFDYGQTLIDEVSFDADKGIEAVLNLAAENPRQVGEEEVRALYDRIYENIDPVWHSSEINQYIEVPNRLFQNYLYGYFGIRLTKSPEEIELLFEYNSHVSRPTANLVEFLDFLEAQHIRTAVISNISLSGHTLRKMLNRYIPSNRLEFIVTSCDYIFRKPHPMIFEMALRKAALRPSEVLYCGDNPVGDVVGASASGIFPVWYTGAAHGPSNRDLYCRHLKINDWNELRDRIAGFEQPRQ